MEVVHAGGRSIHGKWRAGVGRRSGSIDNSAEAGNAEHSAVVVADDQAVGSCIEIEAAIDDDLKVVGYAIGIKAIDRVAEGRIVEKSGDCIDGRGSPEADAQ